MEDHRVPSHQITADQLAEHLKLLRDASRDELDELLTELLTHAWRTRAAQDG